MELSYKPDLADAQEHWRAFWNNDIIKRPCVAVRAPRAGVEPVPGTPMQFLPDIDFDTLLDQADAHHAGVYHGDEKQTMNDWVDLLQRFQARGKSVYVSCGIEELKVLHPQLKPNLVFYDTWADSPQKADDLLKWLESNT